jgi:hypothetical protein
MEKLYIGKCCIGFGDKEGNCKNVVDEKINPYWCPECDDNRIKTINSQLDSLMKSFDKKEA